LQGDPFSPLLFNICFNSLTKVLNSPTYQKMGYIWGNKSSQISNCLQYADDAALIAKDQKCAQGLVNIFDAWCTWAKMDIRIDKSFSFGLTKKDTLSVQIKPNISIKSGNIPAIAIGDSFRYLGRIFDFKMDDNVAKQNLLEKLGKFLKMISNLKIKPQTKLKIFDRYLPSQLSFDFKLYNFSSTWISENVDALCYRYIRKWVEAPVSSCLSEWLITPSNKCGRGIQSFKNRFERISLNKRSALKNSKNDNIRDLFHDSSNKNVNSDSLLISHPLKQAQKVLTGGQNLSAESHFLGLAYQGRSAKIVVDNIAPSVIKNWTNTVNNLPGHLFTFVYKALMSQLPTLANFCRWKKVSSGDCTHCQRPQTNKHVLSNCPSSKMLSMYTSRHNKILHIIANWLSTKLPANTELYVDLPHAHLNKLKISLTAIDPISYWLINTKPTLSS
jgi:hypothetical protein